MGFMFSKNIKLSLIFSYFHLHDESKSGVKISTKHEPTLDSDSREMRLAEGGGTKTVPNINARAF